MVIWEIHLGKRMEIFWQGCDMKVNGEDEEEEEQKMIFKRHRDDGYLIHPAFSDDDI